MQTQSQRIIEKILNSELRDESSIQQNNNENLSNYQDAVQMVIQLDADQSATIKIHPEDDPFILAKAFCFQYSIDPRVINTLANNIRNVKNLQFHQNIHNKSKISQLANDKQNISNLMNVSHSMNQSFNKGNRSTKNKDFSKSHVNKNDSTLMSNDCSRQSVFDRLYQDSRKKKSYRNCVDEANKKQSKISKSILQQSNVSDPCLFIYQKNTKAYKSSMLKRQQLYHLQQQKITQSCTFKPIINPISELIAKKLPQSYRSQQNRQRDVKRIQKFLEQRQQKQFQQCTFQPKTLNKSRSRSKSSQRYKILHEDSRIRRMKRKSSEQLLKLSRSKSNIKINKISQYIVGDKTFFQRLQQDQQKRKQKKIKIQQQLKEQNKCRPQTGRPPKNRLKNVSIGQHLYNQAKFKSKGKYRQTQSSKEKLICKNSDKIYENTKKTAFQYIFTLLDSNEDGLISNTKIQLGRLSRDVLKLITPLLIELQQMEAQLDESQFIEALDRLFNSFSVADRQTILSVFRCKSSQNQQSPSFKPSLNQKSLLWAKQTRPQKVDLYDLWKQTQIQKQQKLQQIRTLKILEELQECTFHPRLFR